MYSYKHKLFIFSNYINGNILYNDSSPCFFFYSLCFWNNHAGMCSFSSLILSRCCMVFHCMSPSHRLFACCTFSGTSSFYYYEQCYNEYSYNLILVHARGFLSIYLGVEYWVEHEPILTFTSVCSLRWQYNFQLPLVVYPGSCGFSSLP